MKERLREILEKVPVPLFFLAYAAWAGWSYYTFMYDAGSELVQKKEQVTAIQQQNEALAKKVADLQNFIRALESKKVELRELAKKLDEMKATLSDVFDVPQFMQTAVTEAKKIGLSVLSLKPTGTVNKEYYAEETFDFTFRGVYVQLLVYLHRLSQLQTIIRVDNFSLKPIGARNVGYVMLEGTVQIKGYHYLRSKADDVTNKGPSGGKR